MNYRDVVLISDETATTATTRIIPLSTTDKISQIDIEYKATSAGTAPSAHPAANISKIQVVDGSDILASVTGLEAQALEFYNNKNPAYNVITDEVGVMAISTYRLNFGRWLWDPNLGLDCSQFDNPQLQITHNYRTADTSASAAVMSVIERAFDGKTPSFSGFLSPKEFFSYTCGAASSNQQIVIPRDRILRKLMLMTSGSGYLPHQIANILKLSENNDLKVPLNTYTSKLSKMVHSKYGRFTELAQLVLQTGGRAQYVQPFFDIGVVGAGVTASTVSESATYPTNPVTIIGSANVNSYVQISGHDPHGSIPIEFGDPRDLNDWYDVTGLGSLNLTITAGSAGASGTVACVSEQLRKY